MFDGSLVPHFITWPRPRLEDGNHSPESEKEKSDKPEVGAQGTMRRAKLMIINPIPSGKLPHNDGKSPCLMEKIHYFYGHVQ